MIDIAQNFGQGGAKLPDQGVGGLRSLLTELRGFRASFVAGAGSGSADLVPSVTVDAVNDSLLAVFAIGDAGGLTQVDVANCYLKTGATGNFCHTDDLSAKDAIVLWFDCDNG